MAENVAKCVCARRGHKIFQGSGKKGGGYGKKGGGVRLEERRAVSGVKIDPNQKFFFSWFKTP